MSDYINKDGLLNEEFFTPICNEDFNKDFDEKGFLSKRLQWYVITNNTSWSNVEKALVSGPYTTEKEALTKCTDLSCWPQLLTAEEVKSITY